MNQPEVTECDYYENGRYCHEPPAVVATIGGKLAGLCQRHKRPEFHPPDLHKRLREARETQP